MIETGRQCGSPFPVDFLGVSANEENIRLMVLFVDIVRIRWFLCFGSDGFGFASII
jgi:hypothetical protein